MALCCNKLLYRKRSPGLSLFSKREYGKAGWELFVGAGSARPGPYRVLVIPTKCSAEGSLPHILIPSLLERLRRGELVCSPCGLYSRSIALVLHLLLTLNLLSCIFLLSFLLYFLTQKVPKTSALGKKSSQAPFAHAAIGEHSVGHRC